MTYFISPIGSESNRRIFNLLDIGGSPDNVGYQRIVQGKFGRKTRMNIAEVSEAQLSSIQETESLKFHLLKQESPDEPIRVVRKVKTTLG